MPVSHRYLSSGLMLAIGFLFGVGQAHADGQPHDWLSRMGVAVQSISYEGTIIRTHDGKVEALKVIHTVKDGVIFEKLIAQEGDGMEIIRIGNEVHSILPERKSVLVEEWNDQSMLFSTLPTSDIRFGNEYDVAIVRNDRIAGRETILLAIRPHDGYRYGHRIWLDTETAFPLQTQLISEEGVTIEQVKFAEIVMNQEIHASALTSSYSTESFTWLRQSSGHASTEIDTPWSSDELPAGFRAVATHEETIQGSEEMITHILFSDGLANVSVFIAGNGGQMIEGPARLAGSNSYCVNHGDYEITAIGEVPAITVKRIAMSMRQY